MCIGEALLRKCWSYVPTYWSKNVAVISCLKNGSSVSWFWNEIIESLWQYSTSLPICHVSTIKIQISRSTESQLPFLLIIFDGLSLFIWPSCKSKACASICQRKRLTLHFSISNRGHTFIMSLQYTIACLPCLLSNTTRGTSFVKQKMEPSLFDFLKGYTIIIAVRYIMTALSCLHNNAKNGS